MQHVSIQPHGLVSLRGWLALLTCNNVGQLGIDFIQHRSRAQLAACQLLLQLLAGALTLVVSTPPPHTQVCELIAQTPAYRCASLPLQPLPASWCHCARPHHGLDPSGDVAGEVAAWLHGSAASSIDQPCGQRGAARVAVHPSQPLARTLPRWGWRRQHQHRQYRGKKVLPEAQQSHTLAAAGCRTASAHQSCTLLPWLRHRQPGQHAAARPRQRARRHSCQRQLANRVGQRRGAMPGRARPASCQALPMVPVTGVAVVAAAG